MKAYFDIDTQIDFLFPAGALYTPKAERLIPVIAELNRFAASQGMPVISTTCAHTENDEEFKVWPPHCVKGTTGQLKPAALLLPEGQQIIIEKQELDLFSNPELLPLLDRLRITECCVYGVLTEYCVKYAAMGLLKPGRKVHLVADAILHQSESAAQRVISDFVSAGGLMTDHKTVTTTLVGSD